MTWREMSLHYGRLFEASGRTQAEIAAIGQVPGGQTTISRILRPDHYPQGPRVDTFLRALRGLGVSPVAFFTGLEADVRLEARSPLEIEQEARLDRLETTLAAVLDLLVTAGVSQGVKHGADSADLPKRIEALFDDLESLRSLRDRFTPRGQAIA